MPLGPGATPAPGGSPERHALRLWTACRLTSLPATGRPPGRPRTPQGQVPRYRTPGTARPRAPPSPDSRAKANGAKHRVRTSAAAPSRIPALPRLAVQQSTRSSYLREPEHNRPKSERRRRGSLEAWDGSAPLPHRAAALLTGPLWDKDGLLASRAGRAPADPGWEAWPLTVASCLDSPAGPRPLLPVPRPVPRASSAFSPPSRSGPSGHGGGLCPQPRPRCSRPWLPRPPPPSCTWENAERPQGQLRSLDRQSQSLGAACHNHVIRIGPSRGLGLTLPQRALGSPGEEEQVTWSPFSPL